MKFTSESSERGVTERLFEVTVEGDVVPCALFTPEGARGPRPLVLFGHGGGQHKQAPPVVGTAHAYATSMGYALLALDAPDHGARVAPEDAPRVSALERERIARSGGMRGEALDAAIRRATRAAREWRAALDAVQSLDFVGAGPVGYTGLSMGAIMGIVLAAEEPRIRAAALGLAGIQDQASPLAHAARRITIPLELLAQWDDELVPRQDALALYALFGSAEKTLHINPGPHMQVPHFERTSRQAFFERHLGRAPE